MNIAYIIHLYFKPHNKGFFYEQTTYSTSTNHIIRQH